MSAAPLGIIIDQSGQIWIAESGTGKLANIDPTKNYKVSESAPIAGANNTLKSPTALQLDDTQFFSGYTHRVKPCTPSMRSADFDPF